MANYDASLTPVDRAKAIAAVAAVYISVVALGLSWKPIAPAESDQVLLQNVDVALPPPEPPQLLELVPPPPPPPELLEMELVPLPPPFEMPAASYELPAAPAGTTADPTPVVAPPPQIMIPAATPIPAARVAGAGSSPSAGAASAGSGTGAGGTGSGVGGGGGGGGGGGIGSDVRLLGGNRSKLPARLLRQFANDRGLAQLVLTIGETGRVSNCGVLQGTGSGEVDQALCNIMLRQSRWEAARDLQGRPISVRIRYTAIWSKN